MLVAPINTQGRASAQLPAEAGSTISSPPSLACYVGETGGAVWLSFADGFTQDFGPTGCGLVLDLDGRWWASMVGGPSSWVAAFVIVY